MTPDQVWRAAPLEGFEILFINTVNCGTYVPMWL